MHNEEICNLFKHYISKENEGRFASLLGVYKHMLNNPSYYEDSLHNEKKKEIECRLKQDAFPRFLRDDVFKTFILKQEKVVSKQKSHDIAVDSNSSSASLDDSTSSSSSETRSDTSLDESRDSSNSGSFYEDLTQYDPQFLHYLETLGCSCKKSPHLSTLFFPYRLEDFKSQTLTIEDLRYLEKLQKDSPHWPVVAYLPADKETIKSTKGNSNYHSQFIQNGGGDIIVYSTHSKHLRENSPTDLPLEKVIRFKTVYYVPYSHHDVFNTLETFHVHNQFDPQNQYKSIGTTHFTPLAGERDFHCYDCKLIVPGLKLSKNRLLNLLCTNFYDEKNQRYIVILKSQGYDEDSGDDVSYGLKYLSFTKITNNLTRIEEVGHMYMSGFLSKEVFLKMLFKSRITEIAQQVLKVFEEYGKKKNFPKLNEKDDGCRLLCLKANEKLVEQYF
ncbi:hypothetical protein ABK040_011747 [Willaertia magna]